jgi:hypothetical protein
MPCADHVQGRFAAGAVEGAAKNFPIDRHNALALLGKGHHEPLKRCAKLIRVQHPEKPAERIVAGDAALKLQEAAHESLLRLHPLGHVHRVLPATQNRAERDEQEFMEVVQCGIAGARVFQPLPARGELFQGGLPGRISYARW